MSICPWKEGIECNKLFYILLPRQWGKYLCFHGILSDMKHPEGRWSYSYFFQMEDGEFWIS